MGWWSVERRANAVFGVGLGLVAALGAVSYQATLKAARTSDWVLHTHQVLEAIEQARSGVFELALGARGYVLSGRESYLTPYHAALTQVPQTLHALGVLVADNPGQIAVLNQLRPLVAARLAAARELVDARRGDGLEAALELVDSDRGEQSSEQIREVLVEMETHERALLAQRTQRSEQTTRAALQLLLGGGLVSLLAIAMAALMLNRALRRGAQQRAELDESLTLLRAVTESTSDAVFRKDLNGRYRMINPAGARFMGRSESEVLGKTDIELFGPIEGSAIREVDLAILGEGGTRTVESELSTGGTRRTYLSTKNVHRGSDGQPLGLIGIARDITERKQREQAQQAHNAELSRALREIEILGESSSLLQACKSADEAYRVIAHALERLFPERSGFVGVIRSSRDAVLTSAGFGALAQLQASFQPQDCWALRLGRTFRTSARQSGPRCAHAGLGEGESLCIPLMAEGEAIGVLHLCVEPARPQADGLDAALSRLATAVAEQIGLALANLTLREMLRDQSIRDPLTGLFNRRFLEESLTRELLRAERKNRPLAVLLLDIDHFKSFNDQFGHAAGDCVLREVCGLLAQHVRADDVLCRFGGEEILVLMPEAPPEDALKRADQLRIAVAGLELRHEGRSLAGLTVSCGVASYPSHGLAGAELLRAADHALYAAKRAGRNRVELAGHAAASAERMPGA